MPRKPPFSEAQARDAIAQARCWAEAARLLGYRPVGGNAETVKRYALRWRIPTDHFDSRAVVLEALGRGRGKGGRRIPLSEVMVVNSSYSRGSLKERLLREGLKTRCCELCGQGEIWCGRRMSLVLDHINGVGNDNRLENLRIVCPNCAATLDTHCGRNVPRVRECAGCGEQFRPTGLRHRYCSHACFTRSRAANRGKPSPVSTLGVARIELRRAERPHRDQLLTEIEAMGYCATGRKYGVSDNAIRKWVRFYENELERRRVDAEGVGADGPGSPAPAP